MTQKHIHIPNKLYDWPLKITQEQIIHSPPHKDYLPDITQQTENESDYDREEDEQPGTPEDYEDDYQENGMQDKKK